MQGEREGGRERETERERERERERKSRGRPSRQGLFPGQPGPFPVLVGDREGGRDWLTLACVPRAAPVCIPEIAAIINNLDNKLQYVVDDTLHTSMETAKIILASPGVPGPPLLLPGNCLPIVARPAPPTQPRNRPPQNGPQHSPPPIQKKYAGGRRARFTSPPPQMSTAPASAPSPWPVRARQRPVAGRCPAPPGVGRSGGGEEKAIVQNAATVWDVRMVWKAPMNGLGILRVVQRAQKNVDGFGVEGGEG